MTRDADLTPEACWNITFSAVPLTYAADANLFGAWDDVGAAESERGISACFPFAAQVGKRFMRSFSSSLF
jgi:hypothetical protein